MLNTLYFAFRNDIISGALFLPQKERMVITMKNKKLQALVEGAIMIAIATVLGYFRLYRFPLGGSIDFALVPILIYCLRWGPKWSLLCCFVNGVLQYVLGGGISISWQSMLLDYVVAYTLVFLCGFAAGKKLGWLWGTMLGSLGRWVSLTLSGGLLWGEYMPVEFTGMSSMIGLPISDEWLWSMFLNGILVLAVMIVDLVVLGIMQSVPYLKKTVFSKQTVVPAPKPAN